MSRPGGGRKSLYFELGYSELTWSESRELLGDVMLCFDWVRTFFREIRRQNINVGYSSAIF